MSDLVNRLRDTPKWTAETITPLLLEAADEIERLKAHLAEVISAKEETCGESKRSMFRAVRSMRRQIWHLSHRETNASAS